MTYATMRRNAVLDRIPSIEYVHEIQEVLIRACNLEIYH